MDRLPAPESPWRCLEHDELAVPLVHLEAPELLEEHAEDGGRVGRRQQRVREVRDDELAGRDDVLERRVLGDEVGVAVGLVEERLEDLQRARSAVSF